MTNPIILVDECEVIATIDGKESGSELKNNIFPTPFHRLSEHLAKNLIGMYKENNIDGLHFLRIKIQAHIQKRDES